jgi:hypothetical protein
MKHKKSIFSRARIEHPPGKKKPHFRTGRQMVVIATILHKKNRHIQKT